MKRTIAWVLSLALIGVLWIPVTALAEGAAAPQETEAPAGQPEADAEVPAEPVPEEPAEADAEDSAEPAGGEGLNGALEQSSVQNTTVQQDQNAPQNTSDTLRFENLRGALNKYNPTILSLEAKIRDLGTTSTDDLWDLIIGLDKMKSQLESALGDLGGAAGGTEDPNLLIIYQTLGVSIGAQVGSLEGQIATLRGQMESLDDNVDTASNTMQDAINQVYKGAETLYVAIVSLENGAAAVERGLEALDRGVAIVEKQQELGMASAYAVESIRHQRSTVESQLESLRFQIRSNKMTLEGMCDMPLDGDVTLGALPIPSDEELDAVRFDQSLSQGRARNVDVKNAQVAYDTDNSGANRLALQAAKKNFESKFKVVCATVPEQRRLVAAAQETVDFQQRTFDIAAKKYELGMLSHEDYLAAQSDLDSARDDLASARLNLFTAYRNYIWARDYGIV